MLRGLSSLGHSPDAWGRVPRYGQSTAGFGSRRLSFSGFFLGANPTVARHQEIHARVEGERPGQPVALDKVAPMFEQEAMLAFGLDTLGDHLEAQLVGQLDD